jgi:hypothetical protein
VYADATMPVAGIGVARDRGVRTSKRDVRPDSNKASLTYGDAFPRKFWKFSET